MRIKFDPRTRASNTAEHGLDISVADKMLEGETLDIPDERKDYGEDRITSVGHLEGRMVVCVWTRRGDAYHVISLRKANAREQALYQHRRRSIGLSRHPQPQRPLQKGRDAVALPAPHGADGDLQAADAGPSTLGSEQRVGRHDHHMGRQPVRMRSTGRILTDPTSSTSAPGSR